MRDDDEDEASSLRQEWDGQRDRGTDRDHKKKKKSFKQIEFHPQKVRYVRE